MSATRPDRLCMRPRCGEYATEGAYCASHKPAEQRTDRPLEHLYRRKQWLKLFRPRFMNCNAICQRIVDGVRCTTPTHQLHHLIEPKTPEMFFNARNIVGLCDAHHFPAKGTPSWIEGKDYSPTNWPALYIGESAG